MGTARRGRRSVAVLALLLAVVVAVTGACGTGDDAVAQGDTFQFVSPGGKTVITYDPADRKPIGPVSGENLLGGAPLSITDPRYANKVVVINAWASWCGPCRSEYDDLEQVYDRYRTQGVDFLGINLRDDRQSAEDFVTDRHVGYPSIYDYPGATVGDLGIPLPVLPVTVILDREHRPAVVFIKSITAEELGAQVARVVAEDGSARP
ncbi:redoxin family protein [Gordonia bronchialis]|uniref:TlpA family protein disulfide reductase n=1 Tax=Gordonia bronchialis TaxID=2054 RepID=UPI000E1B5624|nr:TlpA disulfide reductase family protein [Gordonia bronchialis]MCC3323122.1 TlpA family protein disulfide reductase [Gordonia bronchialis]QGS25846.1 redoxin family protein [Gordonia bronchialis]UAK37757.1 TlpA family protein disulfide reductase [Gordonia bronchialis]